MLTEPEIAHWAALKEQVALVLGLPRHRACADARLLQATFRRLRCRGRGTGPAAVPARSGQAIQ